MTDEERIAAFIAAKGVTKVTSGIAYGVDKSADAAKRQAAREARDFERIEHEAENRFQRGVEENGYYKS